MLCTSYAHTHTGHDVAETEALEDDAFVYEFIFELQSPPLSPPPARPRTLADDMSLLDDQVPMYSSYARQREEERQKEHNSANGTRVRQLKAPVVQVQQCGAGCCSVLQGMHQLKAPVAQV